MMKLFGWFSSKHVDEFGRQLARDLAKKYPPEMGKDKKNKISEKRITRILEGTFKKAIDFKRENKLGFYRKARLGNVFQWELTELGYSKDFVKVATEGLVVYISR